MDIPKADHQGYRNDKKEEYLGYSLYQSSKGFKQIQIFHLKSLFRRFAVGFGRDSDEALEELAKKRNIREVQNLGDFLDVSGRRAQ